MTKLNCNVKTCANNNKNYCCISSIYVGGKKANYSSDTECDSFIKKNSGFTNSTYDPNPEVDISCEAENCMYNCDKMCTANNINISGLHSCCSGETCCASFISRY